MVAASITLLRLETSGDWTNPEAVDCAPINDWFSVISARCNLADEVATQLRDKGFVIAANAIPENEIADIADAYDATVRNAHPDDIHVGSTTVRVNDFVNRGPAFDGLYLYEPLLAACCSVIRQPFKLSTMHARSVHPNATAQALHADFKRQADGWPMVGFIIMIDGFSVENGATRLVAGSHLWPQDPSDVMKDPSSDHQHQQLACGPAGSMLIYNGSVWHGHAANLTDQPRRSIQGAYIFREADAAIDQAARIRPETEARIGPMAKYLLNL